MKFDYHFQEPNDKFRVFDPDGKLLLKIHLDSKTGKYIVDDYATGRIWST